MASSSSSSRLLIVPLNKRLKSEGERKQREIFDRETEYMLRKRKKDEDIQ